MYLTEGLCQAPRVLNNPSQVPNNSICEHIYIYIYVVPPRRNPGLDGNNGQRILRGHIEADFEGCVTGNVEVAWGTV